MSDYTVVTFSKPTVQPDATMVAIEKTISELWDAYSLQKCSLPGKNSITYYTLTIHELDLQESLFILDALKAKYSLRFRIEHGAY